MKQLSQSIRTGLVSVTEVPTPRVGCGQVLVQVAGSLISAGTERMVVDFAEKNLLQKARTRPDLVRQVLEKAQREGVLSTLKAVCDRLDQPLALGYSCAGTVIAVGEGATDIQVGERVACAGGGYAVHAEVVSVPKNLVVKFPENVDFESAAFTTLGAIALQGVRIADVRIGEVVAVIGLGLIGLLTVQILKAAGCRVIGMDINPDRCHLAEELGVDVAVTGAQSLTANCYRLTANHGVDAVIITAATKSNQPIELAAELCREKGRVVVVGAVGMDVPRRPFYEKELELRLSRSYGPGRYDPLYEEKGIDYPYGYVRWTERRNMAAFLDLVAQGKVQVQPLITHRFPIDHALEAYDLIMGKTDEPFLGVLITYPDQPDLSRSINLKVPSLRHTGATQQQQPKSEIRNPKPVLSSVEGSEIRIALIGAGTFAKSVLLPKLKAIPGVELATVCTATGLSARHVADKFGFAACTTDADAIFNDPAINAVLIATRHNLHAPLVIKALQVGKHVFVEKPLALNEEELGEVIEVYRDKGTRRQGDKETSPRLSVSPSPCLLVVGFNRRFAPLTQQVRQFFTARTGPLAIHYRVNAGYVPPDHWVHDPEEGGGRIVGEVCHFVDWIQHLIGASPVRVYAQALPGGGRYPVEDNVLITLTFADGSVGTIHYLANGDPRVPKEHIEVFGSGAVAMIEDFRTGWLVQHGRRTRLGRRLWPRQDKGHVAELQAFITAVREGQPPPIPFHEAVLTTLTTFKIRESLRTGRPVDVSLEGILEEPSPHPRVEPGSTGAEVQGERETS